MYWSKELVATGALGHSLCVKSDFAFHADNGSSKVSRAFAFLLGGTLGLFSYCWKSNENSELLNMPELYECDRFRGGLSVVSISE